MNPPCCYPARQDLLASITVIVPPVSRMKDICPLIAYLTPQTRQQARERETTVSLGQIYFLHTGAFKPRSHPSTSPRPRTYSCYIQRSSHHSDDSLLPRYSLPRVLGQPAPSRAPGQMIGSPPGPASWVRIRRSLMHTWCIASQQTRRLATMRGLNYTTPRYRLRHPLPSLLLVEGSHVVRCLDDGFQLRQTRAAASQARGRARPRQAGRQSGRWVGS